MNKNCETCYYYGKSTDTCDFFYLTGQRRGSSIEQCTRKMPRNVKERQAPGVLHPLHYSLPDEELDYYD